MEFISLRVNAQAGHGGRDSSETSVPSVLWHLLFLPYCLVPLYRHLPVGRKEEGVSVEDRQFYWEENKVEVPSHLSFWPQPSHVSTASCDRNRNAGLLWVAACPSKSVLLWEVLSPKAGREEGRLDSSCQARCGLQGGGALPIPPPRDGVASLVTGADTWDISLSLAARFFGHKGDHFMGENGDSQSRMG